MSGIQPAMIVKAAVSALNKGNLPQAELLCRSLLDRGVEGPVIHEILGRVASRVGSYELALQHLTDSLKFNPSSQSALAEKRAVEEKVRAQATDASAHEERFLLIKAWGAGFWSDVDHVVGALLVAELTGRIPVVHWSSQSLFSDGNRPNAFDNYFEPVSGYTIRDLIDDNYSYFPPKWSTENLEQDNINKFAGKYSRMAGMYHLNRSETVVVSDFHTSVYDLKHWIPRRHPLYGLDTESLYRHLFHRYLKVTPDIQAMIENFRQEYPVGEGCLAVHARGGDKTEEFADNDAFNVSYYKVIDQYLDRNPDLSIFLLTDSESILKDYERRYAGRIVTTQCSRTDNAQGVHFRFRDDPVRIGREVLLDTYIAAGCRYFVGSGRSNVSTAIVHLKEWYQNDYTLIGGNVSQERNLFLHNW